MADIDGDENDNTLNGTSGSDSISGNGGNDDIDGGSGDDQIRGGAGDDTITGGGGDDTIQGGRGDNTMSAGSGSPTDTFIIREGDGNDTITDFDQSEPDVIAYQMDEIQSFSDVQARMTQDGPDTVITYDNGETTRLLNVNMNDLSDANFRYDATPICFASGTWIETPDGPRLIEHLKPGDLVLTLDQSAQPIISIVSERVHFSGPSDRARPVVVPQGVLRGDRPSKDMYLSPQHRVLLNTVDGQMLVAAAKLAKSQGLTRCATQDHAIYWNIVMNSHQIICANGCWCETLLSTSFTRDRYPELSLPLMTPARPIVSSWQHLQAGLAQAEVCGPAHSKWVSADCT
jgi:hypothetical protein